MECIPPCIPLSCRQQALVLFGRKQACFLHSVCGLGSNFIRMEKCIRESFPKVLPYFQSQRNRGCQNQDQENRILWIWITANVAVQPVVFRDREHPLHFIDSANMPLTRSLG